MKPIKHYKNKWDRFTIIMTTLVLIVITIAVIALYCEGGLWHQVTATVLLLFAIIPIFLRPLSTSYDGEKLIVRFLCYKKVYSLSQYTPVYIEHFSTTKAVRIFASGGYFGYWGIWRKHLNGRDRWDTLHSYTTSRKEDCILLMPKEESKHKVLLNADGRWFTTTD